ncbi:MAG: hypothetical protein EPN36_16165 [Rhodanobacteraceae bacterium]|nr:MAG: hypothetical protein EPN36_16165 [Rhodanobacteraceae bacterium]
MRQLSLWMTVLLLGGLPLAAAAVDYGPNSTLLAADTGAPQLPGALGHGSPKGESAKSGLMTLDANASDDSAEANEVAPLPASQRMSPSTASPPASTPRNAGASASNKSRAPTSRPTAVPAPASWQSLLPGSIQ